MKRKNIFTVVASLVVVMAFASCSTPATSYMERNHPTIAHPVIVDGIEYYPADSAAFIQAINQ